MVMLLSLGEEREGVVGVRLRRVFGVAKFA